MTGAKFSFSTSEKIQPREVRRELQMSQRQFAAAFGIPIATLRNWEQGRRKIDMTTASYLQTIRHLPQEVQAALSR